MRRAPPDPSSKPESREQLGEPLLSVTAVVQRLGVSEKTIRRLIARGALRVHRIGRQIRVSEADLAHFLEQHRGRWRSAQVQQKLMS